MYYIDQRQAAVLADITDRRLRQLDHEADPPPRDGARYPSGAYSVWLDRRWQRQAGRLAAFEDGYERGAGALAWRTIDELRALAGAEPIMDLWPPQRRQTIAAFREQLLALPNAEEVAGLLRVYADQLADEGWE